VACEANNEANIETNNVAKSYGVRLQIM